MRKSYVVPAIFLCLLFSSVSINAQSIISDATKLNNRPCLFDGTIEPQSGTARNVYIASVHYYDPDGKRPSRIEVFVDDVSYPLKRKTGKPNDGIYRCKLTLPPGEHLYYFYAEDEQGKSARLPRYSAKKGPLVGVTKPILDRARLTKGGVFQKSGTDKTLYTYTVNYYDPKCNPPKEVAVYVDCIKYPMRLHKGSPSNGTYIATLTLPPGKHAYYFRAIDNLNNCISLPEQGFIRGPEVTETYNTSPQLFDVKLDPIIGYKPTTFTYYVTYLDEDFDTPSLIQIVIDGETYPLKLKQGKPYNGVYTFKTQHYLGNYHKYHFYCEDGRGGSCRVPPTGDFHGPVVVR
ncbi:MAG: hypothetical protein ABIK61_05680 [candidate division WOR-3 bacterium]